MPNENSDYATLKPQLLNFFIQHWNTKGETLSAEKAFEEYGIPKKLVTQALADKDFIGALEEDHGLVFRTAESTWAGKALTTSQLLAANTLLDYTDARTDKKKLQDLGISTQQYHAWLKDPIFTEYLHGRAEQLYADAKHEAPRALLDRVRAGDIKAIEYLNEMTGKYVRPRSNSYGINGTDVQGLIVAIIEIIDEEVTNNQEKLAISERLKQLIARRTMAAELTSPVGTSEGKQLSA